MEFFLGSDCKGVGNDAAEYVLYFVYPCMCDIMHIYTHITQHTHHLHRTHALYVSLSHVCVCVCGWVCVSGAGVHRGWKRCAQSPRVHCCRLTGGGGGGGGGGGDRE
jgi:hypothetical protein